MSGNCVRCQREGERHRSEVTYYGLSLCYSHEIVMRSEMDALERLDGSDPEVSHSRLDDFLLRWAPAPYADLAEKVAAKCDWWACA